MSEEWQGGAEMGASTAIGANAWQRLMELASEGLRPASSARASSIPDRPLLARAYSHCSALTASNSRSFYVASSLLPSGKRQAVRALYAFCRVSDDLVDTPGGCSQERLATWRQRALGGGPPTHDLVATAWADALARHHIPLCYARQLLDGVERDLHQRRDPSFDELAA